MSLVRRSWIYLTSGQIYFHVGGGKIVLQGAVQLFTKSKQPPQKPSDFSLGRCFRFP